MRIFFVLLILCLALTPSAFAAHKHNEKTQDKPTEQIYLETEVIIDEVYQFASDKDGLPISGTVQSFYPNGHLAWETQWINGKLHGITKGYYANGKLKEETTWVDGKLNGTAKWYDEKGDLRRETIYEDNKDLAAPDSAQGQETSPPDDASNASVNPNNTPEANDTSKDKETDKK